MQTTKTTEFEALLGDLSAILNSHFRGLGEEAREDAVAEAVASAWLNYIGLEKRGALQGVTVHTLAYYAVKSVRAGRKVGTATNTADMMVAADRYEIDAAESLSDSNKLTPADAAAFRMDFAAWCQILTARQREVANLLIAGFTTKEIATVLGVSAPAVSYMRRTLENKWNEFQGAG